MTGTSSVVQWQPAAAGVSARFRTKDRIAQAMTPEIVIALAQRDGRIVFGINPDAAAKAGLTISSRLLRLARAGK